MVETPDGHARLVTERLNLVAGGRWSYQLSPLEAALWPEPDEHDERPLPDLVCALTVLGQTHADVGEGRDPKAAFSDALKRAAVPLGVGRSIYAVPRRFLFAEEAKRPPRDKPRRKGERLYLTGANEALLRAEYEQWLAEVGIAAFGAARPRPRSGRAGRAGGRIGRGRRYVCRGGGHGRVDGRIARGLRRPSAGAARDPSRAQTPCGADRVRRLPGADSQGAGGARARRAAARPPPRPGSSAALTRTCRLRSLRFALSPPRRRPRAGPSRTRDGAGSLAGLS